MEKIAKPDMLQANYPWQNVDGMLACANNFKILRDFVADNLIEQRDEHLNMLDDLSDDHGIKIEDAEYCILGLRCAPASLRLHHAYLGGLVCHIMEMLRLAAEYKEALQDCCNFDLFGNGYLDDEFIIRHILYHDLHKAYMTYGYGVDPESKIKKMKHSSTQLMGSDVKSLWLIMSKYGIKMDPLQINCLLNSEGGYADIKTPWVSSVSKFLYHLDEASAGIIENGRTNTELTPLLKSDKPLEQIFEPNGL